MWCSGGWCRGFIPRRGRIPVDTSAGASHRGRSPRRTRRGMMEGRAQENERMAAAGKACEPSHGNAPVQSPPLARPGPGAVWSFVVASIWILMHPERGGRGAAIAGLLFFGPAGAAMLWSAMKGKAFPQRARTRTRIHYLIAPAVLVFTLPGTLKFLFALPLLAAWLLLFPRYESRRVVVLAAAAAAAIAIAQAAVFGISVAIRMSEASRHQKSNDPGGVRIVRDRARRAGALGRAKALARDRRLRIASRAVRGQARLSRRTGRVVAEKGVEG